jgi:transcriptional regulator with XRE-family HTH domain
MLVLAGQLRGALRAAGVSRQQFAERTGLALELIVAVENGYGRPDTARRLLRLAQARLDSA